MSPLRDLDSVPSAAPPLPHGEVTCPQVPQIKGEISLGAIIQPTTRCESFFKNHTVRPSASPTHPHVQTPNLAVVISAGHQPPSWKCPSHALHCPFPGSSAFTASRKPSRAQPAPSQQGIFPCPISLSVPSRHARGRRPRAAVLVLSLSPPWPAERGAASPAGSACVGTPELQEGEK